MTENGDVIAEISAEELAEALQRAAPELGASEGLTPIGLGFYSFVFETTAGWIVRVARTPDAATRHARETAVLPAIAPRLTVAIPAPRLALSPCEAAPFGAQAYRRLPGQLMTRAETEGGRGATIAAQLGAALAALHAIPEHEVPPAVPRADPEHLPRLWATVAPALEARLSPGDWHSVREWWLSLLASGIATPPRHTLAHGDPWWENLTVDDSGLVGVLDWEYLSVSDPANDLGVTLEMGEAFFQQVLASYRRHSPTGDPTLEDRARLLGASRAFYGFEFAIVRNDDAEWADSLESLRRGPILQT